MKRVPNKTWKISDKKLIGRIKSWLLENGGREDLRLTNPYEDWRIRLSDATVTYYKKGTLFATDSDDEGLRRLHAFVESLAGARFGASSKEWLIGFDEAGKGEVFGPLVLVGVEVPGRIYAGIERETGSADTKKKHSFDYWEDIYQKIRGYERYGLRMITDQISPQAIDKYNMNKFLDGAYEKLIASLMDGHVPNQARIIIDDYGVGNRLSQYLEGLKKAGAEVVVTAKADDTYLESKLASLVAKYEHQAVLADLGQEKEYRLPGLSLGSGNAGDSETLAWLRAWKKTGRPWPWFVRTSYKTVREIDGFTEPVKKELPPEI